MEIIDFQTTPAGQGFYALTTTKSIKSIYVSCETVNVLCTYSSIDRTHFYMYTRMNDATASVPQIVCNCHALIVYNQ